MFYLLWLFVEAYHCLIEVITTIGKLTVQLTA